MIRQRTAIVTLCALAFSICHTLVAHAALLETWESQAQTNPFTGAGDLGWNGDLTSWAIATQAWPVSPAQDFAGIRSLRSTNHPSTAGNTDVATIMTNINSAVDFNQPMEWSVFFSGNLITVQPSRRADFILLSDRSGPFPNEDPDGAINGYKLTLTDPYFDATDNVPPSSHEGAALGNSLTLWHVKAPDDRWRVVGSVALPDPANIRDGWNLRARRDVGGNWSIGYASGAIGQTPALTSLGVDASGPGPANFVGMIWGGVGWTAPTTDSDSTEFGFDNFRVGAVPEPGTVALAAMGIAALGLARRKR